MRGWLDRSFDGVAAPTLKAWHGFAQHLGIDPTLALVGGLATAALAILAIRWTAGVRRARARADTSARALTAYAAQLPDEETGVDEALSNARAAFDALEAHRAVAWKRRAARICEAQQQAEAGNFVPAERMFEEIAAQECSRRRPATDKAAAALKHKATLARVHSPEDTLSALARAALLSPSDTGVLLRLGTLYNQAQRLDEAERTLEQLLSTADSGSESYDLACGLLQRGQLHLARSRPTNALDDFWRVNEMCKRQSAERQPEQSAWQRCLAMSYAAIGDALARQSNFAAALDSMKASHAIWQKLAEAAPAKANILRELSGSFDRIGDVLLRQDDKAGALRAFRDGLEIANGLAATYPKSPTMQRDLSVAYSRIGEVLYAQRDLAEALQAFRNDLAIANRVAEASPGKADRQRDVAVSYSKIGDVLMAQNDYGNALVSYRAAHAIFERLGDAAPSPGDRQRELAVSYNKMGDILLKRDALPEALQSFESACAIRQRLADASPADAALERDLCDSLDRMGHVQLALEDLPAALSSFETSRAILARRAAADPPNAGRQRDLALGHGRVGLTLARNRNGARLHALGAFRAGHAILTHLQEQAAEETAFADDLAWFAGQISSVESGDTLNPWHAPHTSRPPS